MVNIDKLLSVDIKHVGLGILYSVLFMILEVAHTSEYSLYQLSNQQVNVRFD
jgi:hypothetical protein